MWFRLMMLAFLFNGTCTFGVRILTAMGLAEAHTLHYLTVWYLCGTAALAIPVIAARRPLTRRPLTHEDIFIGAGLGLLSASGQTFIGQALASGLPGNVVFPVCLAGGLFIVILLGVTVFHERLGPAGLAGVLLGVLSIALLGME